MTNNNHKVTSIHWRKEGFPTPFFKLETVKYRLPQTQAHTGGLLTVKTSDYPLQLTSRTHFHHRGGEPKPRPGSSCLVYRGDEVEVVRELNQNQVSTALCHTVGNHLSSLRAEKLDCHADKLTRAKLQLWKIRKKTGCMRFFLCLKTGSDFIYTQKYLEFWKSSTA